MFLRVLPSIMLPMFLAIVDQTIVATALPDIAAALGQVDRISWIVVSYLVAATIAAPVYGQLGDAFGRRRLMLIALGIFMVSSILCVFATSTTMLTVTRALQGIGGGGLMTLSQALIGEVIPPRDRAKYQGYLSTIALASNGFGPVAGGYLTQHFGWQSIFLVNLPLGFLAILMTLRLEAKPVERKQWSFDGLGLLYFAFFVMPLLLALGQLQRFNLEMLPLAGALAGLGIISLILLIRNEKRATSPLLPISLLRQPSVWRSDTMAACHGGAVVSMITFLPIYLQVVRGATPSQIGLLFLPLMVGLSVGSMVTGRFVSRTGRTAVFPAYGLMIVTISLLFLAIWAPSLALMHLPWLFLWIGLFMGTLMAVVQVTVQSVAGKQLGAAAASVQFSRSVGAALGTAIVSVVLFSVLTMADPETARLFGAIVERAPNAMAGLSPERQMIVHDQISNAFRAAFLTMAVFTATASALAFSMPMRRLN